MDAQSSQPRSNLLPVNDRGVADTRVGQGQCPERLHFGVPLFYHILSESVFFQVGLTPPRSVADEAGLSGAFTDKRLYSSLYTVSDFSPDFVGSFEGGRFDIFA